MKQTNSNIKISDIANIAGVSSATVCRVLNKNGNVSEEVQKRVAKAVEETGYSPQPKRERSGAKPWIAVLNEQHIKAFESEVLSAVQEAALEKGYLANGLQLPQNPEKNAEVFRQLKMHKLAGIISIGFFLEPEEWIHIQRELNTPLVLLNTQISDSNIAYLLVNFENTISNAIKHLLDLGHTRIAYLGDESNPFSKAQMKGVEGALMQRDMKYSPEFRISVPNTAEGASQGINRIMMLPREERPTAIIAFDDDFAIHLMYALRYYNLSIPEDISLIGFDNIPMAAHTYPTLTTIDIPKYRIGRHLVELLEQMIKKENGDRVGHIIVDGTLVVRNSTGPVKEQ